MINIILSNPKYIENLGNTIRAAACFGADSVSWTGDRIKLDEHDHLPRAFRLKDYKPVKWQRDDRPFGKVYTAASVPTPVCVELCEGSIPLPYFIHPQNASYLFGPEDGDVPQVLKRFCHHFVHIPSYFCLNLASAVNVVLYDRMCKMEAK